MDTYSCDSIPIVHNGFRDVMTRLSVSWAAMEHSTNPTQEEIWVKPEHVKRLVVWLEEILKELELREHKEDIEGKGRVDDEDFYNLMSDLDNTHLKILDRIKLGSKSSKEIASELDIAPKTVTRHYNLLKKAELITPRPGKGVELTTKGVMFMKKTRAGELDKDLGTDSVPNSQETGLLRTDDVPNR